MRQRIYGGCVFFTCKELKPFAGLFTPTKQCFPLPPNHITTPGRFRCLHNTCKPEPTAALCTASILLFPQIVSLLKHRIVKIASIMCCLCGLKCHRMLACKKGAYTHS
ncbi:hypothetical protein Hdeb2414_s0026g00680621 [Helianthus debilis subsp. tardiflorus]